MDKVTDYFLGPQITVNGACSHETKRCLFLGRKAMTPKQRIAMTNLDSMLKSRDITWLTMVRLVKSMVFPIVMYGCEN